MPLNQPIWVKFNDLKQCIAMRCIPDKAYRVIGTEENGNIFAFLVVKDDGEILQCNHEIFTYVSSGIEDPNPKESPVVSVKTITVTDVLPIEAPSIVSIEEPISEPVKIDKRFKSNK